MNNNTLQIVAKAIFAHMFPERPEAFGEDARLEACYKDCARHAIRAFLASPEMESCIVTMRQCLDWMEDLRASGDAGCWEWSDRCEYTRGRHALAALDALMEDVEKSG